MIHKPDIFTFVLALAFVFLFGTLWNACSREDVKRERIYFGKD